MDTTSLTVAGAHRRLASVRTQLKLASSEPIRLFCNPPFGLVEGHVAALLCELTRDGTAEAFLVTPMYGRSCEAALSIFDQCAWSVSVIFKEQVHFCELEGPISVVCSHLSD
jgi:hypothetical protein